MSQIDVLNAISAALASVNELIGPNIAVCPAASATAKAMLVGKPCSRALIVANRTNGVPAADG